jgi:twinkle protein
VAEEHNSNFVRHQPCPDCGSSDGCSLFDDGHTYCHVCKAHRNGADTQPTEKRSKMAGSMVQELEFKPLPVRRLDEETCKKFAYGCGKYKGRECHVANYYNEAGTKVVAQKLRFANKEFTITGDASAMLLYGQHLWRDGGKRVVITEGEIDALSLSQVQGNKWPVVSLPNGADAAPKAIRKSLEWLEKFETVVLLFDNDEPGRKAAQACAEILTPGKACIATLPLKDANEMLKAGKTKELVDATWAAKPFRPDGIIAGTEMWDSLETFKLSEGKPYPWSGLTAMTKGTRTPEIILVGAGTGVGKSEFVRQIAYTLLRCHDETVGYVALEEGKERCAFGMMGLHLGVRLHLDKDLATPEERRAAYEATVGSGRFYLYDHWGSTDSDNLMNKIRYMVRGLGCTTIVLDHISIVVSGISASEEGDERRLIDNTMTRLRSLVQELNFRCFVVAHLKSIEGKPHEEGARVTLGHFRGSKSLTQLSDTAIGLERNQQDPEKSRQTRVRLLKNRHTGETGLACYIEYDTETGRLNETTGVFEEEEDESVKSAF